MHPAHSLLSICMLLVLYLLESSFSRVLHHGMHDAPHSSYMMNQQARISHCPVTSDKSFCDLAVKQISYNTSVRPEITSDTVADCSCLLECPVGESTVHAPKLGVLPFCLQKMDADIGIARELGVYDEVMCVIESEAKFASTMLVFEPLVSMPCHAWYKPSETTVFPEPYLALHVCVAGCEVEMNGNTGVLAITFLLDFLSSLFPLFEYLLHNLTLFLKCSGIVVYRILIFFTPQNRWWPQYVYHLNLLVIHCCFTTPETVIGNCKRLKAFLLQNLFRRHDFVIFRASICRIQRFAILFILASWLSMLMTLSVQSAVAVPCASSPLADVPSQIRVGGGRIPLFQLEQLLPHVECSGKIIKSGSSLRFVGHKHKNVAEALYGSLRDHVYGKLPQFLAKLTVKDIKSVSKIHGVHVPSKPCADNIAAVFKDHSCPCCESYAFLHCIQPSPML